MSARLGRRPRTVQLRGKGFDMTYRTDFVIDIIKRRTPPDFYDHRTAKFVSLDKSEMQREGLDANSEENFDSYLNWNVTANNRVTRSI